MSQKATDYGSDARAKEGPRRSPTHEDTSLGCGCNVSDDRVCQCNGTTTSSTLDHTQNQKGGVRALKREPDVRGEVDNETYYEGWSSTDTIGYASDYRRCKSLKDLDCVR